MQSTADGGARPGSCMVAKRTAGLDFAERQASMGPML